MSKIYCKSDNECKIQDMPDNVKNFFDEYEELCKKYDVSLSHEDIHGGFEIMNYKQENIDWVKCAVLVK